mmetsp:Transcript_45060/g.52794  ORF Transcript_45060/g.52794 Transcript_45060/m.52794 type:complete len:93 (+) Transcript_45060:741-1019(+)
MVNPPSMAACWRNVGIGPDHPDASREKLPFGLYAPFHPPELELYATLSVSPLSDFNRSPDVKESIWPQVAYDQRRCVALSGLFTCVIPNEEL